MSTESGYSNQKKKGQSQFKTINQVGSNQFGNPISQKTLFDKTAAAIAITAVTDVLGTDGQVEFWKITLPTHTASKNDVMRMITGTLLAWEYDIIQIIDANNFYILPISDTKPIVAETAKILGWTTSKSSQEGELVVVVAPSPVAFVLDGVDTEVELDTVTPANSIGLPTVMLKADGTVLDAQVIEDSNNFLSNIDGYTANLNQTVSADGGVVPPFAQLLGGKDGATFRGLTMTALGEANVAIAAIPLATNASTAANQIYAPVGLSLYDFSSVNVTSLAYFEIVASSVATRKIQIFMSSGEPLYLAFGAAASEIDKMFIIPGGNGLIDLVIPAATRLSIKAVNVVTVSSGVLLINFLG